jgi:hypothetical protein
LRFVRRSPLRRESGARPLPGASSLRACGANRRPCSAFVVSHHLDGLLRASGRGLVASHTRTGVHPVSYFPRPSRPKTSRLALALPVMRFVPSEVSPSPAAVLHHCSRCPRAVTACAADFEALLRRRVRSATDRCRSVNARSFHGLCVPSKVSPPSLRVLPLRALPGIPPRVPRPVPKDEPTLVESVRS